VVAVSAVVGSLVASGCGLTSSESVTVDTLGGVGELPGELSGEAVELSLGTVFPRVELSDALALGPVADRVGGNRLLVIGDSIKASTSRRYGGEMCATLVPLGWEVEVNAEVGRFVDFGNRVVRNRLDPDNGLDWDAAVISLGTNFGGDLTAYRQELERLVETLEPRPVVLLTVTEFRPDRIGVNEVIIDMMRVYPHVQVLDWAGISAEDPSLIQPDRIHLTAKGRERITSEIAAVLGEIDAEGVCLETQFRDDSAGGGSSVIGVTPTNPNRSTTTTASDDDDGGDPTSTTKPSAGTSTPQPSTTQPSVTQPSTTQPASVTTAPANSVAPDVAGDGVSATS